MSGAVFMFRDAVFVLPALVLVPLIGPTNIRILHYVEPSSVEFVNIIVAYSLVAFVFSLALFGYCIGPKLSYDLRQVYAELQTPSTLRRILVLNRVLLISIPAALFVSIVAFGAQHALFGAMSLQLDPGAIRHMNENTPFVSYVKHYFSVISIIIAPILSLPIYRQRPLEKAASFLFVFIALTAHGAKSPFIFFLIVYSFALLEKKLFARNPTSRRRPPLLRYLVPFGLLLALVFATFYFLVTTFFAGADFVFWDYFWNRAFIGQMAGVYEQFNLFLHDPAYLWHSVPFASFFVEYPNFHKDLMLVSEDLVDPTRIGIKVTFFAAEAYGMFGWAGVIFAPFSLSLQFVASFLLLNFFVDRSLLKAPELSKYITAFFFASYFAFTDGVSEMVFLKGTVMVLLLLSPAALCMALRGSYILNNRHERRRVAAGRGAGAASQSA